MANDIIRKIEDLIESIDEFNEKYVTYNAKVLRIILLETIDYIKQKDRALDEIKEIAEENIRIADLEGLNGVYRRGLAEQIIQKVER